MAPGRKETRALFPHLSPPLPPLYILSLIYFASLFQALAPSLSPLLHCFPMALSLFGFPAHSAAHRTSTRSQEHAKYVPTRFLQYMSSCFPNPVQQTRQHGARLAGGDLKRYDSLLRPRPLLLDLHEFLRAGSNKQTNCSTLFISEIIVYRY